MTLRQAHRIGKNLRRQLLTENAPDEISEAFDHYNQFSPWEFTAKAFNDSRDPERTWEEFERGLYAPVRGEA